MKRMWSKNELAKQVKEVKKDITTLVDAQGRERFIEGPITLAETLPSGCTSLYGKWSLSGSHLMMVIAVKFDNGVELPSGNNLIAEFTLPKWIHDKIVPTISSTVEITTVVAYDSGSGAQSLNNVSLTKSSSQKMTITKYGGLTFSSEKIARFIFDLLIDAE